MRLARRSVRNKLANIKGSTTDFPVTGEKVKVVEVFMALWSMHTRQQRCKQLSMHTEEACVYRGGVRYTGRHMQLWGPRQLKRHNQGCSPNLNEAQ